MAIPRDARPGVDDGDLAARIPGQLACHDGARQACAYNQNFFDMRELKQVPPEPSMNRRIAPASKSF